MKEKLLDSKHVKLQFLMMLISLLAFLFFASYIGNIIWLKDFRNFVVLLSGIFAIFAGLISLLRYYTQRISLKFLFIGMGFVGIGLLDIFSLILDIGEFSNLFAPTMEAYSLKAVFSKGFLALLLFLSWFFTKETGKQKKKELLVIYITLFLSFFFVFGLIFLLSTNIVTESILTIIVSVVALMFLIGSLAGYFFRKNWLYDNFDFWLIFGICFFILSQIFYLPFLNLEFENMVNLSVLSQFFGYISLLIGFLNSISELYAKEIEIKNELVLTKKKVEEAYLVIRKEKWDLVEKSKGKKINVGKKRK